MDAGKEGGNNNPKGSNQYSEVTVNNVNSDLKSKRPMGNSAAATLRRLSKDFPTIHERVLSGELSPNKAALEAGFRQPKIQLPADAEAAGRYLASRVSNEWMIDCYDAYMKAQDKVQE